jgi:serine dehydrogenase proteinase
MADPNLTSKPKSGNAGDFIEHQLDLRLSAIEADFSADAVAFNGPLMFSVDDIVRNAVEKIGLQKPRRPKLAILLTTPGGYIETVHRIVDTLRRYYSLVDFIIPNYAYSAGTVLAMSGDAIYMDYYSRLGPIDPQVETQGGRMVPALGYLERYEALIRKAKSGTITAAEIQLLLGGFDQGELYQYEQSRELSIGLLKEWLAKYKFKNWTVTRTRKKRVTKQMKTAQAAKIARELNMTSKWHVHGYGISKDVLDRDLGVQIDDFATDPAVGARIREYHDLLSDYMGKTGSTGAIHIPGEYRSFLS